MPAPRPYRLRQAAAFTLALLVLPVLAGCFTFETFVRLNRDGSGTVEQLLVFSGPMVQMMALFPSEDGQGTGLCEEEALQDQAADLGAGVQFTSAESIEEEGRLGCRSFFAFDDVNTLRVNQSPGSQMPGTMTSDDEEEEEERITFAYTPGASSTLVLTLSQNFDTSPDAPADEDFPTDSTQRNIQRQMMREMLKGGRVEIGVEVPGPITDTDATYAEGREVTLFEVDFDRLLEDEGTLERLMDASPQQPEDIKALIEDVPGIKVETRERVTIQFR